MKVKIELDLEDAQNVLYAVKRERDDKIEFIRLVPDKVIIKQCESLTRAYESIVESINNLIKGE